MRRELVGLFAATVMLVGCGKEEAAEVEQAAAPSPAEEPAGPIGGQSP